MDEMEFTEAESNMNDLVSEYQQYQVCIGLNVNKVLVLTYVMGGIAHENSFPVSKENQDP